MFVAHSKNRRPKKSDAAIADVLREVSADKLHAYVDMLAFPRHYVAEKKANTRARDLLLKGLHSFGYAPLRLQGSNSRSGGVILKKPRRAKNLKRRGRRERRDDTFLFFLRVSANSAFDLLLVAARARRVLSVAVFFESDLKQAPHDFVSCLP